MFPLLAVWKIVLVVATFTAAPQPVFSKPSFPTEQACKAEMAASVKRILKRAADAGEVRGRDFALRSACIEMSVKPAEKDEAPKDKGEIKPHETNPKEKGDI